MEGNKLQFVQYITDSNGVTYGITADNKAYIVDDNNQVVLHPAEYYGDQDLSNAYSETTEISPAQNISHPTMYYISTDTKGHLEDEDARINKFLLYKARVDAARKLKKWNYKDDPELGQILSGYKNSYDLLHHLSAEDREALATRGYLKKHNRNAVNSLINSQNIYVKRIPLKTQMMEKLYTTSGRRSHGSLCIDGTCDHASGSSKNYTIKNRRVPVTTGGERYVMNDSILTEIPGYTETIPAETTTSYALPLPVRVEEQTITELDGGNKEAAKQLVIRKRKPQHAAELKQKVVKSTPVKKVNSTSNKEASSGASQERERSVYIGDTLVSRNRYALGGSINYIKLFKKN